MKGKHFIKVTSVFLLMITLILSSVTVAFAAENGGQWKPVTSMPTTRASYAVSRLNDKIYVLGGYNIINGNEQLLNKIDAYDPATDTWTEKTLMSTGRESFNAEVVNGKIYAIGGCGKDGALSSVEEYDPIANKCTVKAPMPTPAYTYSSEVIDGKIYVFGGRSDDTDALSVVQVYDPSTDKWVTKASLPTARFDTRIADIDGKIYLIGGRAGNSVYSVTEEYDPSLNKWALKDSMKTPRDEFSLAIVNKKIYVFGGYSDARHPFDSQLSSIEEYDLITNTWKTKSALNKTRHNVQSVVVNNKIYNIGGVDAQANPLADVEEYDPSTDTCVPKSPMINSRKCFEAIVYGNSIYAFGGISGSNVNNCYISAVEAYTVSSDSTLTVAASPNKVKVGQQFTTDVAIHNVTNICAEDIKITYDKDLFEYEGATGQTGTKIYKEDTTTPGTVRFITACQGKDNAATGDKRLITLKFKAKKHGVGKVEIIKGRIADNATLEEDVADENCGEDTITVDGYQDVNRSGNFTLLDLGIDAYYYGMNASDTDSTKYDADVIPDGKIDDNDLTQITQEILANKDYAPNN